jgi:zinc/manganese transport system permease protein
MYRFLFEPFADPAVRHSLAAIVALSFSAAPIGVFLMLRRMSLIGDPMPSCRAWQSVFSSPDWTCSP